MTYPSQSIGSIIIVDQSDFTDSFLRFKGRSRQSVKIRDVMGRLDTYTAKSNPHVNMRRAEKSILTDLISVLIMAAFEMCFQALHEAHFPSPSLDQLRNCMNNIKAISPFVTYQIRLKNIPTENEITLCPSPCVTCP